MDSRVTLFSLNHYFADYSLRISLVLSLSLSLSILIMVKNWIEMRGFPNKDFAILMFDILLFARFFFFFFLSALDLRLFLVFFLNPFVYLRVF